jgi:hypothetical protein
MMVKRYLIGAVAGLAALTASAQTQSTNYNFTGGIQTFTVPCGVDSVFIQTWGAQGGSGDQGGGPSNGGTGGLGGYAEGWLMVNPGDVLNIFVGGQGATPTGGFNGGGNGGTQNAGGGGGASDVRTNGTAEANRVITAGGGGGGGRGGCDEGAGIGGDGGNGGPGSGGVGVNGFDSPQTSSSGPAGGGFGGNFGSVQGGSGGAGIGCAGFLGSPGYSTSTGSGASGGSGQSCCCTTSNSIPGGGGGGGGQIGGGGGGGGSAGTTGCSGNSKGGGGGGGGGSSYTGGVAHGVINTGIHPGDGVVTISYAPATPAAANITGSAMSMCANAQDTLTFSTPLDPQATFYTWTVDAGLNFISGQNTNSITVTSMSAGSFTVAVYANSPCAQGPADTLTVTVNAPPSIALNSTPAAVCTGGTVVLSAADTTNSYVWNPGNMTGSSVSVMPSTSTTYTAVATAANGCVDSTSILVTVNQPPVVTLSSFSTVCLADGPSALTNGNPAGGVYSGPGVSAGNFDPGTAGIGTHTITYTYTDANGCTASDSASLNVDACMGIANIAVNTIAVTPNPATDVVTIGWNANSTVTAVKVMDAAGRVVMTQTTINGNTLRLDVSALPAGTYTVSTEGSVTTVQTFVKQ